MNKVMNGGANVMLIDHKRLFCDGLLGGTCKTRQLGAFTLYISEVAQLCISIADGAALKCRVAAVAPYVPHTLLSPDSMISTVMIEPESVSPQEIAHLAEFARESRMGMDLVERVRNLRDRLRLPPYGDGFSTLDFDRAFFNRKLQRRALDDRIERTVDRFESAGHAVNHSALDCALLCNLSTSRFLHLFKEETGLCFRSYRAWRRARSFLYHANRRGSFTYLALDLGYPDSMHFSHSIRRIFGLDPTSIHRSSEHMTIVIGQNSTSFAPVA